MGGYQKDYNYEGTDNQPMEVRCQQISSFHEGLAAIKQGKKWGYINTKGEIEIPCQFYSAYDFSEGYAVVENKDKLYGYIDKKGKQVVPYQYTLADDFSEGLAAVKDDVRQVSGYINVQNEMIIQGEYESMDYFSEGLASISVRNEEGIVVFKYIDKEGKIVIDNSFDDATPFHNGFARVERDSQIIIINKQAEEVFSTTNYFFIENKGELLITDENNRFKFYNLATGLQKVLPENIDSFIDFTDGLTLLETTLGKQGALDEDGNVAIPFSYDDLFVSEGLIYYLKKGVYGFLNYQGAVIIPAKYDHVYGFNSGLAKVRSGKKEFFIDQKGEIAFYVKQKESSKVTLFIIGILLLWIALIVLVLI